MSSTRQHGITLIEGMLTLTTVAVLLVSGLPSLLLLVDKSRLANAADTLRTDLHYAVNEVRLEGNSAVMNLSFRSDGREDWCYGLTVGESCDCRIDNIASASACVVPVDGTNRLRVVDSADFDHAVRMPAISFENNNARIAATRKPSQAGKVSFTAAGRQIDVAVTAMGRVRLCTSTDSNFSAC
jgi:Tfp pilus assembly protein FimT